MKKTVKMALYAEPGVGKSTFASKAPNVFFITTDGNFSWLGLPDEQHVEVSNWNQLKKIIELMYTDAFDEVETVVLDLLEDAYKLCEDDFCVRNKIQYIGDLDYGKGYAMVKNEFTIEMSKLISLPKNVIFLLHGYDDTSTKDARGNTKTKHVPSNRIPDKVLDVIEGKLRYFLRAYIKTEVSQDPNDDRQIKKRYLSLIPKGNEYGIARGLDEANCPQDIELEWDTFAEVIGLNDGDHKPTTKSALQQMLDEIKPSTGVKIARPTATAPQVQVTPQATLPKANVVKPATAVTPKAPTEPKKEVEKVETAPKPSISKAPKEEVVKAVEEATASADTTAKMHEVAEKPETIFDQVAEKVEEPVVKKVEAKPVSTEKANDINAKLAALKALKNRK